MGPDGTAVSSLNSGTPDFSDLDYWKSDKILNLVDSIPNMSATDSASIGAAFVRNDSDTSVTAKVVDTTLAKADSLTVESDAASTFSSDLDVNVSSSGGSNMWWWLELCRRWFHCDQPNPRSGAGLPRWIDDYDCK